MFGKNGFIMIMVVAFLSIILLVAWAIVSIGCSEILQTRIRNDLVSAYYIAQAGAEKEYATLRSQTTVTWGQTMTGSLSLNGSSVGTFSTVANTLTGNEFCVVSDGTVNGRTTRAVVKYGFISDFTGAVPLGSIGPMSLTGASNPAKLKIEGPVISNSTITTSGFTEISNGPYPDSSPPLALPTFWCDADLNPKIKFDTNNDGSYVVDTNGDGVIALSEAQAQGKETVFTADNAYSSDNEINDKDAFYYYYTVDLNNKYGLGIAPGQANYYSAGTTFNPGDVSGIVSVIFIDGNVTINQNDQNWTGGVTLKHTIAATGGITLTQPTNRPGDVLTVVSFGDVSTSGTMGAQGGTTGDLIIYANNNFTAEGGGKANASIFAKGTVAINTVGDDQGADHRTLNKSTIDWTNRANWPLGLPKDYAVISLAFTIQNESSYKPVWQRN